MYTMALLALLLKVTLVTACVYMVMAQARRGRVQLAGLVAVAVTALSLGLLASHHDAAFVADAAVGALLATPVCALFAVACAALVQRGWQHSRPWAAPLLALGIPAVPTTIGMVWVVWMGPIVTTGVPVGPTLMVAALAAWLAPWCIGSARDNCHHGASPPQSLTATATTCATGWGRWCIPLVAGLISGTVTEAAASLGPNVSGLLTSLPTIALCLTLGAQARSRSTAVPAMLQAYGHGLRLRVLFTAVVALQATTLGAWWALALATALVLLAGCWVQGRVAARRAQGHAAARQAQVEARWDQRFPQPDIGDAPAERPSDYSARAISSARFQSSSVSISTTRQPGSS